MEDTTGYDVYLGLDVGKTAHHGCALLTDGTKVHDKPLPQDEAQLTALFDQLKTHGRVLLIVDQPNTIGALPVAVARATDCGVAYLPGLAMRKAADLYPGQSKTDPRDAFIIANTARTMPHTLRAVDRNDEVLSALKMLSGLDDDIARDCTRTINRLRSILVQIYPSLERVLPGDVIQRPFVLELLIHYGGPTKLKKSGKNRVLTWARNHAKKNPDRLVEDIFKALDAQTVTVPGTAAAEVAIPMLATNIKSLKAQRESIAGQVEEMLDEFPLAQVLMSMPGVGIKTAANILLAVGDCSDFPPDAAHLAAYAGIAPVTRRSGTSIRGEFPARSGNKRLKNALFRSAWVASNCHAASKMYYEKKRAEGKRHNAAVMCLARRRCNVIFAMLTNGEFFRELPARAAGEAVAA
ncbi:IS110 family transposase [Corynebacterium variabile]|uniref:IS110 family transposase n=1 Tax=Corynebacterium variabile TaxID=1727 RepID=UPI00289C9942|nr:IS110 family transposase [Corynebacterium variabile]